MRTLIAVAALAVISGCAMTPQAIVHEGIPIAGNSPLHAQALRDCISRNWNASTAGAFTETDTMTPPGTTGIRLHVGGPIHAVVIIWGDATGSDYTAHWHPLLPGGLMHEKVFAGC